MSSPADAALIALFAPYCGGLEQEQALLRVLPVLAQGTFQGCRVLSADSKHDYVLSWSSVRAPLSPCRCDLNISAEPALHFCFEVQSHQLASWLMDVDSRDERQDLPDHFWSWLLLEQDPLELNESLPLH
ncbi:MAG: transglycosylase [Synechococcus sp.]|nr:transglycosylase [Synechococcus sp.]